MSIDNGQPFFSPFYIILQLANCLQAIFAIEWRTKGECKLDFNKSYFSNCLKLAKGDRSINKYGNEASVDPGYISRLLRGLVDNAPSAAVIKKLADAARNGVSAQELMAAAGYLDIADSNPNNSNRTIPHQWKQWEKVIEEAGRYNISPEAAVDLIQSLGQSLERIKKGKPV